MSSIQFQTELHGESTLAIPAELAAKLPKSGLATVVVVVEDDADDNDWRKAAYQEFLKDDTTDDDVYNKYQ